MLTKRLLAVPLSLALALAGSAAVMAQEEEAESAPIPDTVTDQAEFAYGWLQTWFAEADIDPEEGMAELDAWYNGLGDEDAEDLAEFYVASEGISAIADELGDGTFLMFGDEEDEEESE